jgi:transcriptional regulator with XRE-family HTH domain
MTKLSQPRLLTGAQLRAARALLNLHAEELARDTKVSLRTIRRAEGVDGIVPITAANAERLMEVLEKRGVKFLPMNGDGPGVRLRKALN